MLERKKNQLAITLAFDMKVTPKAKPFIDETCMWIFIRNIIYCLFNQFTTNNLNQFGQGREVQGCIWKGCIFLCFEDHAPLCFQ
jgi:translation initiation factor IF-2